MSNLEDLDKQIAQLQEQRKAILSQQRDAKLSEAKKIISDYGFTATDLGLSAKGKKSSQPKAVLEPIYAHPTDKSKTWHGGRGAKPKWVKEHLDAGGKLEDLLIKK